MSDPLIRAEIVGTRMAETGAAGYYTNSTCYSVLVYYSTGNVKLVEGDANQINYLLPYMRPKADKEDLAAVQTAIIDTIRSESMKTYAEISKMNSEMESKLEKLHTALNNTNAMLRDIVSLLQPIPDIVGKSRQEAIHILNNNNLICKEVDGINERVGGIVISAKRDPNEYNAVHVKLKYDLPNIQGQYSKDAKRILKDLGFLTAITMVPNEDDSMDNRVLDVVYTDGSKVELKVASSSENAFFDELERSNSMISIQDIWEKTKYIENHPKTNDLIRKHADEERQYGKSLNIGIIKLEIKRTFENENL